MKVEKMNVQTLSPNAIKKLGLKVLSKNLGPIGMVRFLQQFDTGAGNYTEERRKWLKDADVKTIVEQIKSLKRTG